MRGYLTQSNQVKGLTKGEYEALCEMCRYAKNWYNVGLYSIHQYFFAEGRFLRYESNYQAVKDNENYAGLQAGVSQQILKVVDRSVRSFCNLLKKAKHGEYRFHAVRIPQYLDKNDYFPLILSTNAIVIKNGYLQVPMSRAFQRLHPDWERIKIPFPSRLAGKTVKEVRILPMEKARFFTVQFVYKAEEPPQPNLSTDKALAIDLGLDNWATCVNSTEGSSFILDGKSLKSINPQSNARMAQLQSIFDQQEYPRSEQMARITMNRNNQVHDYMLKAARYLINYCLKHQIGTLIVGYNLDWTRAMNHGTRKPKLCADPVRATAQPTRKPVSAGRHPLCGAGRIVHIPSQLSGGGPHADLERSPPNRDIQWPACQTRSLSCRQRTDPQRRCQWWREHPTQK